MYKRHQIQIFCVCAARTVWRELIFLKHSDAQDILVEVVDEKLAAEVPLGVRGITGWTGRVALSPHRQLTVGISLA